MAPVGTRNAVCLTCHEGSARINWQQGKHANNDVACTNCHTVHAQKDPVLVKNSQPEKCFTCHAQQRAESFQLSHHPIREGKVVCSDCHSVHGSPSSEPGMLKEFTVNETCYNCHADKRGPMLFEHQPVRENCDSCHTPHGSTQARLLSDRLPYSCISCHSADVAGGHSGVTNTTRLSSTGFIGGASVLGNAKITAGTAAPNVTMQTRACLNCHSEIHGSNSPNGFYFFR
jgi:DmsE family decaheme c-type cytochrome